MPPTVPYLSDPELLAAPTGIDWATIPRIGASASEQHAERARLIHDASSLVDTEAGQKLEATHDQETLKVGGSRAAAQNGVLFVQTKYSPVISVELIEWSGDGAVWQTLTGTVMITDRSAFRLLPFAGRGGFVRATYTDGYPHTSLSGTVAASDTSIGVQSAVGIRPGTGLALFDGEHTETVVVDANYTPEATTVPLTAALVYRHVASIVVSAIPDEVRYAARLFIQRAVRLRDREAMSVVTGGGQGLAGAGGLRGFGNEEIEEARDRLKAFRRVI